MSTSVSVTNRRRDAVLTGVFFILAAISSIVGLKLYDPVLVSNDFITTASVNYHQVVAGALNELILCVSACGTALMLYPYLKQYRANMGVAYLTFRLLEVVFIMMGLVAVLTVLSISKQYAIAPVGQKDEAILLGRVFMAFHDWTFMLGPNFMLAINTFLYSFTFFKTGLVPRKLAIWGMVAAVLIMLAALLEMFGIIKQLSITGVILALPIAFYEMTLAVTLIVRGLNKL